MKNTFRLYTQALKPVYPKNIANVHFYVSGSLYAFIHIS